jgi:protein-S-isoprenylcysteine O-methyltransferase Ste14
MPRKFDSWINSIPVTITTILFISQIILGLFLLSDVSQIDLLAFFGVGLYVFSGLVFGLLPVFEFQRRGEVEKGKSYIHTTRLVDTGIYSIVRHPQYVTFILWAIAGMALFQHWIVILLGVPVFPLTYVDLVKADKEAIGKFGGEYGVYMERVPRANFLLGIVRWLRRR